MDLHKVIKQVMPTFNDIRRDIHELRYTNPALSQHALASLYLKRTRNKYTSVGVVTALPGIIPGLGTTAQIAVEVGATSADIALMLRWMASLAFGIGLLYDKDIEAEFDEEFTVILGIWAGVVVPEKASLAKGDKISVGHFDKHITDRIKNRMNQKIGRKLVTKYGSKRGGAALGRLIPFGIGAVVGGTFNYFTIERFGKAAVDYFTIKDKDYYLDED
jgi:hypothetical protein